jgi:sensor histidine kinase regulating citrate/malate metabolism
MTSQFKSKQRGISFLGLIVVGVLLAMVGVIGAQVFPTYLEYTAVNKAVNKASLGSTVAEVRNIFDKQTQVDDIKSITGKDLEVSKDGEKIIVRFAYEREIHLTGPAFLTLKYTGQSK